MYASRCWRRHSLSISNGWFLQVYNWTGLSDENSQDVAFPYRTFIEINRNANTILESVDLATGLDADRKIIKGQALLYRAFAHFNWYNCTDNVMMRLLRKHN
jgi:hypothetical protein